MSNPSLVLDQMVADPTINNHYVDVDKAFGPQCWDVVELFAERCGVPKEPWAITLGPNEDAYEAWTVFDAHMQRYFTKIPAGHQQKGDIGVVAPHPGGEEGHIFIWNSPTEVFEQNADPDGAPCHLYNRKPANLYGSLRITEVIMFNEKDRINVNVGLYGYDKGFFKEAVNQTYHDAIYTVLGSDEFKNENTINAGDVANINSVLGGDASVILGQVWKPGTYDYILKNAGGNFTPVSGTLYTKDA